MKYILIVFFLFCLPVYSFSPNCKEEHEALELTKNHLNETFAERERAFESYKLSSRDFFVAAPAAGWHDDNDELHWHYRSKMYMDKFKFKEAKEDNIVAFIELKRVENDWQNCLYEKYSIFPPFSFLPSSLSAY